MTLRNEEDFLNFFWNLAESDDSTRTEAVLGLVDALKTNEDDEDHKDLLYTVERLVRGLTSERKCARLGFYTALCVVLKTFDDISVENVLEFGKKHLKPSEKNERRNCNVALMLLYASVVRCDKKLSEDVLSLITKKLVNVGRSRYYLEMFVSNILSNLLEKVDENEFETLIYPICQDILTCGWENSTPFDVWLLFLSSRLFPNVINGTFLKEKWEHKSLMKKENWSKLGQIMMKSTSARPNIHPVCVEIVTAARKSKNFQLFWTTIIDDTIFPEREKKYLAFELAVVFLPQLETTDEVKIVLSENFIRQFIQNLSHRRLRHHGSAKMFAASLVKFMSEHENSVIQSFVVQLLLTRPGSMLFDVLTKTRTIASLLNELKIEALEDITNFLTNYIVGDANGVIDSVDADNHRKAAAKLLESLFKHKKLVKNWDWKNRVICFFVKNAFFNDACAEKQISAELHSYLNICLMRIFGHITSQTFHYWKPNVEDLFTSYYEAMNLSDELRKENLQMAAFDDEATKCWKRLWKVAKKLRENKENEGDKVENRVFEVLYLQLMLQLLVDAKEIMPLIEEVEICYENAKSGEKGDEDEPSWIQVLIDITLSLVSKKEQRNYQGIIDSVINLLAPQMSVKTVQQILNVVSPPPDEDVLVDEDDEEDEDEDEEAEMSEIDSSSEEDETKDDENKTKMLENAFRAAYDNNSDESDVDLDDVDEEELQRKDKIFAGLLRTKKKNFEAESTLGNFKLRCLNLLNVIVDVYPTIPVVCAMVVPVLDLIVEYGNKNKNQEMRVLNLRAEVLLRRLVLQKNFEKAIDGDEEPDFLGMWHKIVKMAENVSNLLISRLMADGITVLIRCLKKSLPEGSDTMMKLVDCYKGLVKEYFDETNSFVHLSFVSSFLDKNLHIAGEFMIDFIDYSAMEEVRLYRKTQGLGVVIDIIKHSDVTRNWDTEKWNSVYTKLQNNVELLVKRKEKELKSEFARNVFKVYLSFYEQYKKCVTEPLPLISEDLVEPIMTKLPKKSRRVVRQIFNLSDSKKRKREQSLGKGEKSPKKKRKSGKMEEKDGEVMENVENLEMDVESEVCEKMSPKKKRKSGKMEEMEIVEKDEDLGKSSEDVADSDVVSPKKKRKSRKMKEKEEEVTEKAENLEKSVEVDVVSEEISPKRKRKSRKMEEKEEEVTENGEKEEEIVEKDETEEVIVENEVDCEEISPKKKRKSRNREVVVENLDKFVEIDAKCEEMSPKKTRKSRKMEEKDEETTEKTENLGKTVEIDAKYEEKSPKKTRKSGKMEEKYEETTEKAENVEKSLENDVKYEETPKRKRRSRNKEEKAEETTEIVEKTDCDENCDKLSAQKKRKNSLEFNANLSSSVKKTSKTSLENLNLTPAKRAELNNSQSQNQELSQLTIEIPQQNGVHHESPMLSDSSILNSCRRKSRRMTMAAIKEDEETTNFTESATKFSPAVIVVSPVSMNDILAQMNGRTPRTRSMSESSQGSEMVDGVRRSSRIRNKTKL